MELICAIFERLLLLSVLAIPLLLVIAVFRMMFSKVSKRYVLLLWAVLAVRLVCPIIINNPLSILPSFSENTIDDMFSFAGEESTSARKQNEADKAALAHQEEIQNPTLSDDSMSEYKNQAVSGSITEDKKQTVSDSITEDKKQPVSGGITANKKQTVSDSITENKSKPIAGNVTEHKPQPILGSVWFVIVWLLGCCLLLGYGLFRELLLRHRLSDAIPVEYGVYLSDRIKEPFACGLVKPRIYLPAGMAEEHREAVLSHEQEHIRHWDTRINMVAYLLVCVYWFSPFIVAAYFLFLSDLEMACDERVVCRMDGARKQRYASALLACGSGHLIPIVYPVAFGKSNVSKRIQNIIMGKRLQKRTARGMLILVLLVALCFGSGCERLISSKKDSSNQPKQTSGSASKEQGKNQRTIVWQEDITGDGRKDTITVDVSALTNDKWEALSADDYQGDGKETTVSVVSGITGEEIYSVNLNPVEHKGGLYLYKKKLSEWMSVQTERTYLLFWEPGASDDEDYHYEIFSLSNSGEKRVEDRHYFKEGEKFSEEEHGEEYVVDVGGGPDEPTDGLMDSATTEIAGTDIDNTPLKETTYLERVNEYLFHSIALVDTVGGVTRYSKEAEQMTLLYDGKKGCSVQSILGAARDSIEESDFIRTKEDGWKPYSSNYPGIPFYVAYQEEWKCEHNRFRVYFHCEDRDAKFYGYRNEEEIEVKEEEEQYKESFICVNSWELEPNWAPYIIWSPPSETDYKEHIDDYYVTAYVVDEQETKLLAKQTIVMEWREDENKMMCCYVKNK